MLKVQDSGCRVQGVRCRVQGPGFRVQGVPGSRRARGGGRMRGGGGEGVIPVTVLINCLWRNEICFKNTQPLRPWLMCALILAAIKELINTSMEALMIKWRQAVVKAFQGEASH